MQTSTLRPGFLVVVRTSIRGNVSYYTTDMGTVDTVEGEETQWQTNRLVRNKNEQARAVKARSLARSAIQTVCAKSDFGLLCPQDKAERLDAAIAKANGIAEDFNAGADLTKISFNVMVGVVANDDQRAISAINSEMRDLIDSMAKGIATLDVTEIRKAANKATSVGKMLEPGAQATVKRAITLARESAKAIVKAGEAAAIEVDQVTLQRLQEARTAFLDLDPQGDVQAPEHTAPAIDLEPDTAERALAKIEDAFGPEAVAWAKPRNIELD